METQKEILAMLEMTTNPAFLVKDGHITHLNLDARQLLLEPGTPIAKLLPPDPEEYAAFTEGRLHLMLTVADQSFCAVVRKVADCDLFCIEPNADQERLQTMALVSSEMRMPLASIVTAADQLLPVLEQMNDPSIEAKAAQINHGLNQLHRLAGNLWAAFQYTSEYTPRMSNRDICAVLEEIFAHIQAVVSDAGYTLQYSVPEEQIYCLINEECLERAVFNMISNAMKFTPPEGTITVKLTRRGKKLYLSVQDSGCGIPSDMLGTAHARYRRQPGIAERRFGMGVGMTLLRSAATVHGGTVLIDQPQGCGTRVTMSIAIRSDRNPKVRDDEISIDHAGGRDRTLIELSDVLPPKLYRPHRK